MADDNDDYADIKENQLTVESPPIGEVVVATKQRKTYQRWEM